MNPTVPRTPARGLAALRRFVEPRPQEERCELCATPVGESHQHLVDPDLRRLVCACDACAILFDHAGATHYRRVPRDIRALPGFDIDDALWNSLSIPISLVFFFRSSVAHTMLAVYPSPAGPTETVVDEADWTEIAALHPELGGMAEDVEALLVNRSKGARTYYIVPIDACYKLSAIVRRHWSGFSGGDRLWDEIRLFFDGLERSAIDA
jgi:hypothetical protein